MDNFSEVILAKENNRKMKITFLTMFALMRLHTLIS